MTQTENSTCDNEGCGSVYFDESGHQLNWHRCPVCNNKKTLKNIIGTDQAFALLFDDNVLLLWGNLKKPNTEGTEGTENTEDSQQEDTQAATEETASKPGNSTLYYTKKGFAELDAQGNVTTWGHEHYGGDSSEAQQKLHHITDIASTNWAFAAVTEDKQVVTWGYKDFGGDSQSVQDQLTDIIEVVGAGYAFAARTSNGKVVTWGELIYTKAHIGENIPDAEQLLEKLNSTGGLGGNSDKVADFLQQGITQVVATDMAFAAHKVDISNDNDNESVVVWGNHYGGGTFQLGQYYLLKDIASVSYENKCLVIINVEGEVVDVPAALDV